MDPALVNLFGCCAILVRQFRDGDRETRSSSSPTHPGTRQTCPAAGSESIMPSTLLLFTVVVSPCRALQPTRYQFVHPLLTWWPRLDQTDSPLDLDRPLESPDSTEQAAINLRIARSGGREQLDDEITFQGLDEEEEFLGLKMWS